MKVKSKVWHNTLVWGKCSGVALLLLIYVFSSFDIESLPGELHNHQSNELHTNELELDPCHISFYHEGRAGGCDHEAHLAEEDKCPLCHIQVSKSQIIYHSPTVLSQTITVEDNQKSTIIFLLQPDHQFAGRAPPFSL